MMRSGTIVRGTVAALMLYAASAIAVAQNGDAAARYADAGQQALAAGQYKSAEDNFSALAKLEPGVAEIHATLGLIYFQERNYEPAVAEIRLAKKLKPGLTRSDSLLAMSLSELGDYKEALPGLEKAFAQSSDPAIKRMSGLQLMRAYTGLKQDQRAVEVALTLDKLYGKDPEVLYNTGKVYGNYAFLTIQSLAQQAPNSVWRHLAAAEAYESQGSSLEAVREYRAVLAIEPRRPGIHYRIGRTLLAESHQTGAAANVDEARREYELELDLDPGNGNAAYEIAEIYRQAGRLDLAEQFFERAISHYPDFGEAQDGLSAVLIAANKAALALPHLKAAIAINPDDEVSWYRLSQVDRSLGDNAGQQDALAHFRTLHQAAVSRQAVTLPGSPKDVTKQQVDPDAQ